MIKKAIVIVVFLGFVLMVGFWAMSSYALPAPFRRNVVVIIRMVSKKSIVLDVDQIRLFSTRDNPALDAATAVAHSELYADPQRESIWRPNLKVINRLGNERRVIATYDENSSELDRGSVIAGLFYPDELRGQNGVFWAKDPNGNGADDASWFRNNNPHKAIISVQADGYLTWEKSLEDIVKQATRSTSANILDGQDQIYITVLAKMSKAGAFVARPVPIAKDSIVYKFMQRSSATDSKKK